MCTHVSLNRSGSKLKFAELCGSTLTKVEKQWMHEACSKDMKDKAPINRDSHSFATRWIMKIKVSYRRHQMDLNDPKQAK